VIPPPTNFLSFGPRSWAARMTWRRSLLPPPKPESDSRFSDSSRRYQFAFARAKYEPSFVSATQRREPGTHRE
jgi:hypothetical protein